jgi:hypothetical protein
VGTVRKMKEGITISGVENGEIGVVGHSIDGFCAPAIECVDASAFDDGFDEFVRREFGIFRIVRVRGVEDLQGVVVGGSVRCGERRRRMIIRIVCREQLLATLEREVFVAIIR